jgi:tripartite-type tricarboxylate transporter receptor subunit TctC
MNSILRRAAHGLLLIPVAGFGVPSQAAAQPYPSHTIRIVVPSPASTPPDIVSRIVATELASGEGWRVVVENRVGGSMSVGVGEVQKSNSDGHSILAVSMPLTAIPAIQPKIGMRLEKDFAPVIQVSRSYNVLVVNPSLRASSLAELVTLLKSSPDIARFSSGGVGTPAHLIGEMFKLQTGVPTMHIPYQQYAQAIADLLNGTNHYMFISTLPVVSLIQSGQLRALATTGEKRTPVLKEIPTVVEEGFPGLVVSDWVGFAVKTGTPNEIVGKLNTALNKVLAKPNVREALDRLGAEPVGGQSSDFGILIKSQVEHWAKVVRDAGIKSVE